MLVLVLVLVLDARPDHLQARRNGTHAMEYRFDHEKLRVYQEAIAFVAWWEGLSQRINCPPPIRDQLDRGSTSIPLNIAEGNGKVSNRDRRSYLQIARGSALECAAALDVLVARKRAICEDVAAGKVHLHNIVNMLTGLIIRLTDRVAEETGWYDVGLIEHELEAKSS